ncbi:MAG TPA: hypothetical protein VHU84_04430, partial [Lacipirellulaceae bacterium]|nr:hypothetical protein [Lacipirellulaceae bacterium]
YAGTPGNLLKVVREGDIIDVDPSSGVDNRTVKSIGSIDATGGAGGQDGHGPYLNDAGLFVYELTFTDGSSGIFTSSITMFLAGDFNHDGRVDAADYIVWRQTSGPSSDYDLWRAHFGESIAISGSTVTTNGVPEPHLISLLFVLAASHSPWRRRRPR